MTRLVMPGQKRVFALDVPAMTIRRSCTQFCRQHHDRQSDRGGIASPPSWSVSRSRPISSSASAPSLPGYGLRPEVKKAQVPILGGLLTGVQGDKIRQAVQLTDERLHQPSAIGTTRPLRQFDFRRVGGVAVFKVKSYFLDSLGLEFRGLCEPVPFSLGFALRALAALNFQSA
jgi:hypothetical protein